MVKSAKNTSYTENSGGGELSEELGRTKSQNMMNVGSILRRTREHYDQSLAQVEQALNIRVSQIEAIENGETDKLPGRVYAIGFVRSYAEYLGLDGDKIVNLYKREHHGNSDQKVLDFPSSPASGLSVPPWWVFAICTAGLVALLVFWVFPSGNKEDIALEADIPTVAEALEKEADLTLGNTEPDFYIDEKPSQNVSDLSQSASSETEVINSDILPSDGEVEPSAEDLPPQSATQMRDMQSEQDGIYEEKSIAAEENVVDGASAKGIVLDVKDNTWVEIKDGAGEILVSKVLKAGDGYFVPNRPDLQISLGNAGGVVLEVDGKVLGPFGKDGEILRDIPLDTKSLKAQYSR